MKNSLNLVGINCVIVTRSHVSDSMYFTEMVHINEIFESISDQLLRRQRPTITMSSISFDLCLTCNATCSSFSFSSCIDNFCCSVKGKSNRFFFINMRKNYT